MIWIMVTRTYLGANAIKLYAQLFLLVIEGVRFINEIVSVHLSCE